jgi:phosphohistidine phosphatase
MPTLYLLRHAKSSWDDPSLADHERPLAPRGQRAADLIGEHLRSAGIAPGVVLCSSAARARETLERVAPDGEVRIEDELYGASERELLERLHQLPAELDSAMLIGHNPALQELTLMLAAEGPELRRVHRKFPTAALATLAFDGDWSGLRLDAARLVEFVRPRDLAV